MKKSIILLCFFVLPFAFADLKVGFYRSSCPQAESVVKQVVQKRFNQDKSITAALLRLHFHDCFVRGCDASILIESVRSQKAEKDSSSNFGVRGFDLIDEIKERLEDACPSTVSCADIITLATRDSVALSGGPKYEVPTGRRDGLISDINEVNLPGPGTRVPEASEIFASKGISREEMVVLLGAHTVGVSDCRFFLHRLSSQRGGKLDPTMDPGLDAGLIRLCNSTGSQSAFLDQKTPFLVDNEFFKQILVKRGVLKFDQQLALDSSTRGFVSDFASNDVKFQRSFAEAMIKMGKIQVLEGGAGEIRKNCRAFNKRNQITR